MTLILTRQMRKHHSKIIGTITIEHTYLDKPASTDTWIDNVTILAKETGLDPMKLHAALFANFPDIFDKTATPT
jgi:hypothetical protein